MSQAEAGESFKAKTQNLEFDSQTLNIVTIEIILNLLKTQF